jgi:hypothetical protein
MWPPEGACGSNEFGISITIEFLRNTVDASEMSQIRNRGICGFVADWIAGDPLCGAVEDDESSALSAQATISLIKYSMVSSDLLSKM